MPTVKSLEEQGNALFAKQSELVSDERPWSEKREEYDNIQKDIDAVLEQHKALKAVDTNPFMTSDAKPVDTTPKSPGEQFVESDVFKAIVGSKGLRDRSAAVELKATFTDAGGGAGGLVPTYLPGVTNILFQRLTVADLFPSGTTDGNSFIYVKESTVTNAASSVAEGGAKPGSDLNLTQVTETYHKIATSLKASDEVLNDVSYARSYINGRLMLFVQIAQDTQLLTGNGVAPEIQGLLNRSGLTAAQAKGADTAVDAIYKDITKIRVNAFVEPSGIVMHPNDWQDIRLSKDQNNQYYGGGPFTGAYGVGGLSVDRGNLAAGASLWGLPVVVTTAMTEGTALVGAFNTCAQLFTKGGVTVEMTNSNEDDFLHDLVAFRAEIRQGLAVYRPSGFSTVTGI